MADSILDRLVHNAYRIELAGESIRKKKGRGPSEQRGGRWCVSAPRLILKQPTGWFAAGRGVAQALALLSDAAFKLYMHLCLQADRHTGRAASMPQLTQRRDGERAPAVIEAMNLGELQVGPTAAYARGRHRVSKSATGSGHTRSRPPEPPLSRRWSSSARCERPF